MRLFGDDYNTIVLLGMYIEIILKEFYILYSKNKMKKIAIFLVGVLLLLGCSKSKEDPILPPDPGEEQEKEKEPEKEPEIKTEFQAIVANILDFEKGATIDNSIEVRTSLTHDTYFSSWRTGDEIGVVSIQSGFFNSQSIFNIKGTTEGTTVNSRSFSGNSILDIDENYGFYYPYNKKTLVGGVIEFDMPIQIETGNYGFENFAACDFLFSNQLLESSPNRNLLLVDKAANLEFTHGVAVIQIEISKSSFQGTGVEKIEKIYSVELRSINGESIFPQRVTLEANGKLTYSEKLRSMYLFAGNDGYDLTSSDKGFGGFLILFPFGDTPAYKKEVNFLIHTNAGTFVSQKILPQFIAHHYYTLNFDNATLSEDILEWSEDHSIPDITGKEIFISKASELAWVAAISNSVTISNKVSSIDFKGYTIVLTNDIDLGGKNWTPIKNFKGTINGNGKVISNLKITGIKDNQGLIGVNKGGVIIDLTIDYPEIIVRANNIGAIAGNCESGAVVNCIVAKGTVNGKSNVGGLIGKDNYSLADNCINDGTIVTAIDSNVGKRAGNSPVE